MRNSAYLILLSILSAAMFGCATSGGVPQGANYYANTYRNQIDPGNTIIAAGANYTVEQTPDLHYIRKEYYFETGQKTIETSYADKSLKVPDGKATEWYDNGNKWSEGSYKLGKRVGEWKEYSFGQKDKISSYGLYSNGLKQGLWIGLDSLGNKSDETLFKNGEKVGDTKYFNPDGTVRTDWMYTSLESGEDIQVPPSYPCNPAQSANKEKCGEASLLNYLASNIKYPARAREEGIMGTAIITFVVDKDGSITSVTPLRGICNDIKAECVRIVQNMPKWNPGMANGKPVKVRFTLPVRFRLE